MSNIAIVTDFIAAWDAMDLERILGFMAPDIRYHNIPMEPINGVDACRAMLGPFMGMASRIEFVMVQIAENAQGAVLTERIDKFLIKGKWIELPVMGTFEFKDGKISHWRDYFDLAQFNAAMAAVG